MRLTSGTLVVMSWLVQARRLMMTVTAGVLPDRGGGRHAAHSAREQTGRTGAGAGGADLAAWPGLGALDERLAAADGIIAVSRPPGGPAIVALEVPCALSWAKISSC